MYVQVIVICIVSFVVYYTCDITTCLLFCKLVTELLKLLRCIILNRLLQPILGGMTHPRLGLGCYKVDTGYNAERGTGRERQSTCL